MRDAAERRAARAAGRDPVERPPISMETVREYVRLSTPTPEGSPRRNRYQDNPLPAPSHLDRQRMVWVPADGQTMAELRSALWVWFRDRAKARRRDGPAASSPPGSGALECLTMEDVARIWTEERRKRDGWSADAVAVNTVKAYVWWSQPAKPGRPANRYQDHPVPESVRLDTRRRVWIPGPGETLADVEQKLRDWYNDPARPGKGVGGGRKPATKTTRQRRT